MPAELKTLAVIKLLPVSSRDLDEGLGFRGSHWIFGVKRVFLLVAVETLFCAAPGSITGDDSERPGAKNQKSQGSDELHPSMGQSHQRMAVW